MLEKRDKIIDIDISKEMKKSYIDYAMSVIVSRALPDVRDGLKPVHRRILYSMKDKNFTPDKPHRKSANIVGDVLGRFHPHGDSSVYNAMVRMAQNFSIRYLLVDGHGNFGSIDGDSAAAMRYTEARMTKLAMEMLRDIDKKTVDMMMNYDETIEEPKVLPSRFPNLLVNGSNGIAVGMATSIPPHNLSEVIDGVVRLIDYPESDVEDLLDIIKGPDFPTGAIIMGYEGFKRAYRTGKGSVVVRSKAEIEEIRKNKMAIIVKEIPYQINKSKLLESIAELVKNKKIDGISDLRDESDRNGIRVVIEIKKDANANVVLNKLYKQTQLQSTYSMNFIALVDGVPKILNLYDLLKHYLNHQKDVETRRIKFDLDKAEAKKHILEGLIIALDNIDRIIKLIRGSKSASEAKLGLIEEFNLSEIQAQAILDMRLQKLTGLEREKIENEYDELVKLIAKLKEILTNERLLLDIIKENLLDIKEKFGDERRTKVEFSADEIDLEDLIEEDEVIVTLTHRGYIKRVSLKEYTSQKRGGRGKAGVTTKEEDFLENIYTTSTHDYILFFTNFGKVYRLKGYNIPEGSRTSKGTAVVNLLELENGEVVTSIIPIKDFKDGYLMICTKNGIIKKTLLNKYDTSRKSGLRAINLKENDELISVNVTSGEDEMIIVTENGKSIRFNEKDVREMGRIATGVIGIRLDNDDKVVMLEKVNEDSKLLVVSKNGYGKRTSLDEYKVQARGGKGIKTYNISKKTGKLIGALIVSDEDEMMLINNNGILIRISVSDISISKRATSGVTLMKTDEDNYVVSIAKVIHNEIEENEKIEE